MAVVLERTARYGQGVAVAIRLATLARAPERCTRLMLGE